MESGKHTRPIWVHNTTQASKLAYRQAMCLHAWAHVSAKLEWIREIKLSMESGEQAGPFWAQNSPWACKLACMHPMCLPIQANISAKLGQIREIKVSMESGEHAGPLWAHNLTQACKLVCMHAMQNTKTVTKYKCDICDICDMVTFYKHIRSCQVWSGQIRPFWVRLGQVRTD